MVSADRQTIMETNRSLRNIKTELENLLEKGVIDETVFDKIHATLPQESPLSGPLRTAPSSNASPAPVRSSPAQNGGSNTNAPPTQAFQNLGVNSSSPAPPSYDATPAPNVPNRNVKPIVAHARALYRYGASDTRDLSFEKDDKIAIHEYMNQDWWMGQNLRTGQEGIFPRSYVFVEPDHQRGAPPQVPYGQPQYGYPNQQGPPPQQNPYNANVPPMAVAEGGQPAQEQGGGGGSKAGEYGKKFGKKLGNAAVFGAGATIGSNIVNSIF